MQRENLIKAKIWAMPFVDRVCILTASIIENNNEATSAISGLIGLVEKMAERLGTVSRFRIAEQLRNTADVIERELQRGDEVEGLKL